MPMQAPTDALLFVSERVGMKQWRQDAAGPDRNRFDALEKSQIGQDTFAFYNHGGAIAVASAWLVIYVIAATQPFIAWSLSLITSFL